MELFMIKTGFYDKCVLRAARAILFHLTACLTFEYILSACWTPGLRIHTAS